MSFREWLLWAAETPIRIRERRRIRKFLRRRPELSREIDFWRSKLGTWDREAIEQELNNPQFNVFVGRLVEELKKFRLQERGMKMSEL